LKKRKLPIRMCLGCREMKEKRTLIRMVKSPDGKILIDDLKGKSPGRGAYICLFGSCIDKVMKAKSFERAFGQKIESEVFDELKSEFINRKKLYEQSEIKEEVDG